MWIFKREINKRTFVVCLFVLTQLHHLPSAEASQLPLCQLVNQMVSLEKEGCNTCELVETTICSGHCVTKVLCWRNLNKGIKNKIDEYKKN